MVLKLRLEFDDGSSPGKYDLVVGWVSTASHGLPAGVAVHDYPARSPGVAAVAECISKLGCPQTLMPGMYGTLFRINDCRADSLSHCWMNGSILASTLNHIELHRRLPTLLVTCPL